MATPSTSTVTLSPLDQLMPRVYTRVFLTFASRDPAAAAKSLEAGLRRTCANLPYLRGRVHSAEGPDARGQVAISYGSSNADPVLQEIRSEAEKSPSYAELLQSKGAIRHYQEWMCPVGAMCDLSAKDGVPVMAASYVAIEGGVIACFAFQHNVMDGTGVGVVMSMLARNCARGEELEISEEQSNEIQLRDAKLRSALSNSKASLENQSYAELMKTHPEYRVMSELLAALQAPAETPTGPPPARSRGMSKIFRFSASKLAKAKAAINALQGHSTPFSTNDVLAALVWANISRVRSARMEAKDIPSSKLGFAVNGRRHLGENFPSAYVGNVNLYGLASTSFSDLASAAETSFSGDLDVQKLVPVATSIRQGIFAVNAEHIAEAVALVQKAPDAADIIPGWNFLNGPDVSMTSWAGLGLYECDFGADLGKPEFVRVPFAQVDGLIIVLPRKPSFEQGSDEAYLEVVVMLSKLDMEKLEQDAAWRSWTS